MSALPAPADDPFEDLTPRAARDLDEGDDPMVEVTLEADDVVYLRTALRTLATTTRREAVELAATELEIALEEPLAYLRRHDTTLPIGFEVRDVALLAVATLRFGRQETRTDGIDAATLVETLDPVAPELADSLSTVL